MVAIMTLLSLSKMRVRGDVRHRTEDTEQKKKEEEDRSSEQRIKKKKDRSVTSSGIRDEKVEDKDT